MLLIWSLLTLVLQWLISVSSISKMQASPATPDMIPSQMQGNPHYGPMIAGNPFEDHRGFPPNSMPYSPNSMSGMPNSMSGKLLV